MLCYIKNAKHIPVLYTNGQCLAASPSDLTFACVFHLCLLLHPVTKGKMLCSLTGTCKISKVPPLKISLGLPSQSLVRDLGRLHLKCLDTCLFPQGR